MFPVLGGRKKTVVDSLGLRPSKAKGSRTSRDALDRIGVRWSSDKLSTAQYWGLCVDKLLNRKGNWPPRPPWMLLNIPHLRFWPPTLFRMLFPPESVGYRAYLIASIVAMKFQ